MGEIEKNAIARLHKIKQLCLDTIAHEEDKELMLPPSKECCDWCRRILKIADGESEVKE